MMEELIEDVTTTRAQELIATINLLEQDLGFQTDNSNTNSDIEWEYKWTNLCATFAKT